MKTTTFLFTASLLAALPLSAHAKIERVIEKSFNVSPGGHLTVSTRGGNVRVDPGTGDVVKVVAKERFRADSEKEADEIANKLTLQIEQSGADVSALAKYEGERGFSWSGSRSLVEVDFVVTVPAHYHVDLHTSGGNIAVGDLMGEAKARTSGGNVDLGKIEGPVNASTSGGNISVNEVRREAKLHTSGGDIRVTKVLGETEAETSGGNIKILETSGKVRARTSGGDVSAAFATTIPGDCSLETSGGSVKVTVNRNAAFRLDARTSGGDVRVADLTLDVKEGGDRKSKIVAVVGGGGPELKLRTSGGDVRVSAN